ncbi:Cif family virulence factor [Mucilaginibacter myungsuensis]|uniref:Nuclear transport factor 2 family protein n=1 Tax=Mucilaginibacter myungsuensis TaxID=649104 RepID=A0A929KY45_9SPHI|nr:hypothetical protein [Mucilaginibacter myungsuensis]MBE9663804.1 hypothetical protein [Mucilaginibacter myungsuensis]MDN3598481.1 hypothetical protein [Mucilaginibacter myungsuensis]
MKRSILTVTLLSACIFTASAQRPTEVAKVQTVVTAEENFAKTVARKGIKDGFLANADAEGIVFKPDAKNINDFYAGITKQPGTMTWSPKFARISANGDLAFTAGPYVYDADSKKEDDKVYGDYVSVWRKDGEGRLKLLIQVGVQHPEPDAAVMIDMKDPDTAMRKAPSKDPFRGKGVIMDNDKTFNYSLTKSTLGTYKEFFTPAGRYYFPGYEPVTGIDKTMKFLDNEAINIAAETVSAGRANSGDLAYSYGKARIKKGNIVSNFYYLRIWELDAKSNWNVLTEIFSAVEQ